MKAISTKYVGPTNTRGSRVIATDGDGHRASVSYSAGRDNDDAHRQAALTLCKKMDWSGCERLLSGGTKTGKVFVFVPEHCKCSKPLEGLRGARGRRSRRKGR